MDEYTGIEAQNDKDFLREGDEFTPSELTEREYNLLPTKYRCLFIRFSGVLVRTLSGASESLAYSDAVLNIPLMAVFTRSKPECLCVLVEEDIEDLEMLKIKIRYFLYCVSDMFPGMSVKTALSKSGDLDKQITISMMEGLNKIDGDPSYSKEQCAYIGADPDTEVGRHDIEVASSYGISHYSVTSYIDTWGLPDCN